MVSDNMYMYMQLLEVINKRGSKHFVKGSANLAVPSRTPSAIFPCVTYEIYERKVDQENEKSLNCQF